MRYIIEARLHFRWLASILFAVQALNAQSAESLKNVHRISVGSLGSYSGSEPLRHDLIRFLKTSRDFEVVPSPDQSDAILEGRGELWIKGYHALSPRARTNKDAEEPLFNGYLSVRLRGRDNEILWSYFANPPRVSVHDLQRDLVNEVVSQLKLEHKQDITPPTPVKTQNDIPADLRGGGATFPFPIYQDWFQSFQTRHPAWKFVYTPTGSEAGVTDLMTGNLDFAGSDIAPGALPENVRAKTDFFPSVGGAVVLIYNLPGFNRELNLTGDVIAGIFSGAIRSWNDPKIVALNPTAPNAPIKVFHRSDGSGTTFVFSDYLSRISPEWNNSMGAHARLQWKVGQEAAGNDAISAAVAATPYSIGYTEFIYAFNHHLNFASVLNRAGRYMRADLLSIMAAANSAGNKIEDLSLSIVNSSEATAYPISTFTWIALPRNLTAAKRTAALAFLDWMLTSGQRQCSGLGYAPLPRDVVDRELSAVRKLR